MDNANDGRTQEEVDEETECLGHPAGAFDPMGVTVYCDGTCIRSDAAARNRALLGPAAARQHNARLVGRPRGPLGEAS